jgi:NagD protein
MHFTFCTFHNNTLIHFWLHSLKLLKLPNEFTVNQIKKEHFYTSAMATASFLQSQTPNGTAYVVGSAGLTNALYNIGYTLNDTNPDYVVVGETQTYNFHMIERAVHHIKNGAKLVGTNRDILDRVGTNFVPSTGY